MNSQSKLIFLALLNVLAALLAGCSSAAGWKATLSNGTYHFADSEYSIESPISVGMCLDIQERNEQREKGAQFKECHGYIQAIYIASIVTTPQDFDEASFIDITKAKVIPAYLDNIFQPQGKAKLASTDISTLNGKPAIYFSGIADLPAGKYRVLSARVLLDKNTILSRVCQFFSRRKPIQELHSKQPSRGGNAVQEICEFSKSPGEVTPNHSFHRTAFGGR